MHLIRLHACMIFACMYDDVTLFAYMYDDVTRCMHLIRNFACTHARMHVCVYVYICTCMCACTYTPQVCVHVYIHRDVAAFREQQVVDKMRKPKP